MSSKTKFNCCFCNKSISPKATAHGNQGWCMRSHIGEYHASCDLFDDLNGPHTCNKRIQKIIDSKDSPWSSE